MAGVPQSFCGSHEALFALFKNAGDVEYVVLDNDSGNQDREIQVVHLVIHSHKRTLPRDREIPIVYARNSKTLMACGATAHTAWILMPCSTFERILCGLISPPSIKSRDIISRSYSCVPWFGVLLFCLPRIVNDIHIVTKSISVHEAYGHNMRKTRTSIEIMK